VRLLPFVAAVLLAGCVSSTSPGPGAPLDSNAIPWTTVRIPCDHPCFEPTAAADGNVTYVAAQSLRDAASNDTLVRVALDGSTLAEPLSNASGHRNDIVVAVAPWHDVDVAALVAGSAFEGGSDVALDRSTDGGRHWSHSVVRAGQGLPSGPWGMDRPWLAFSGTSTVYLVDHESAPAVAGLDLIVLRRSDDAGATFGGPVVVASSATRGTLGPSSAPVVSADGSIAVAAFAALTPAPQEGNLAIEVYRSTDGGQTFAPSLSESFTDATCGGYFPALAGDGGKDLALAWTDGAKAWVALSPDAGGSWSTAAMLDASALPTHPGVAFTPAGPVATWFRANGTGADVAAARNADGVWSPQVLAAGVARTPASTIATSLPPTACNADARSMRTDMGWAIGGPSPAAVWSAPDAVVLQRLSLH